MVEEKYGAKELIPTIDLTGERSEVSKLIVKACEGTGFFKVINHGVPFDVIEKMVDESCEFFAKPESEKQRAGPPDPYGYGSKTIGRNGDTGEVEYILLHTNPLSISQCSNTISNDPTKFSSAANGYVKAVRVLACEILELIAEGLCIPDVSVFSKLIRDVDNDSLFRLNYYPSLDHHMDTSPSSLHNKNDRIGFGEHSDPQILTILRSNDVAGLQICLQDMWIPVVPDPAAFFLNVGDLLQVMTNGRFESVRHRAMVKSNETRMSMAYFATPPLHATISPLPLLADNQPPLYRPFTWAEYKKVTYSLRLSDTRLGIFNSNSDDGVDAVWKSVVEVPPLAQQSAFKFVL
ncbi:hypothetical protein LguiB_025503 [Lonicera macranthoides]